MRELVVADVGDGLCAKVVTLSGEELRVDCGSQQGGETAFEGLLRTGCCVDRFLLSHFHTDHYNGIMHAAYSKGEWRPHFHPHRVTDVWFPAIPAFDRSKDLAVALFTLNWRVLGEESGIMEYDLLQAMSRLNGGRPFRYSPLSVGDTFMVRGSEFTVLWPPKSIVLGEFRAVVDKALEEFEEAREQDEELEELHGQVKEAGVFPNYFATDDQRRDERGRVLPFEYPETGPQRNTEREDKSEDEDEVIGLKRRGVDRRGGLPEAVTKANESLRGAANFFCLAFRQDDRLLFMGDLEEPCQKEVVAQLQSEDRMFYYALVTPHHGTKWQRSMNKLTCQVAISSNGKRLSKGLSHGIRKVAHQSYATHVNGDIRVSAVPSEAIIEIRSRL